MIAQAQSGTGKTATFAISILQKLDTQKAETQALVLAPTRELAQQIQKVTSLTNVLGGDFCPLPLRNLVPLNTTVAPEP